jgi:hypothetical protein
VLGLDYVDDVVVFVDSTMLAPDATVDLVQVEKLSELGDKIIFGAIEHYLQVANVLL